MRRSKHILLICILGLLLLSSIVLSEAWKVDVTAKSGDYEGNLQFGVAGMTTNGYDDTLDENFPLAPPSGAYAFFAISDTAHPHITKLVKNFKSDSDSIHNWKLELMNGEYPQVISWDSSALPSNNKFKIASYYPDEEPTDWTLMGTTDSIIFSPAMVVQIKQISMSPRIDGSPYVSSWSPEDSSTGNSAETPIEVEIVDDGSGVNPGSISLKVNGTEVSDYDITPISLGYNVRYTPDEPFTLGSDVSVQVSAEDCAFPSNSLRDSITFGIVADTDTHFHWTLDLSAWSYSPGADTSNYSLTFGLSSEATDGYDPDIDIVHPPAPGGEGYAYFPLNDSLYPHFSMLNKDIKSYPYSVKYWKVKINSSDESEGIKWNPSTLPEEDNLYITSITPGDVPTYWAKMDTLNNMSVSTYKEIWIKATSPSPDTTPPIIFDWNPVDGDSGVAVNSNILVYARDEKSEVDPGSVRMYVNGEEVTSELSITSTSSGKRIFYDPLTDFPPETTVSVAIRLSDDAESPNFVEDSISFFTVPALSPAWMSALHFKKLTAGDTVNYSELYFGVDESGSSGYDDGIDLPIPPPPPVGEPYSYFSIDDPVMTNLMRDIRSSEEDTILWECYYQDFPSGASGTGEVTWEPSSLPEEGSFKIAIADTFTTLPDDMLNMRDTSLIKIENSGKVYIQYLRSEINYYCLRGDVLSVEDSSSVPSAIIELPALEMTDTATSEGYFEICGIPEGSYSINVRSEGFLDYRDTLVINRDIITDFYLQPEVYSVCGSVNLDGRVISYDSVDISIGDTVLHPDASGTYCINNLSPDEYSLSFDAPGFERVDTSVTIVDSDVTLDVTLNYSETGRIIGYVTLEGGASPESVSVILDRRDTVYTPSTGFYNFEDVDLGLIHELSFQKENYITYDTSFYADVPTIRINVELEKKKANISGTVFLADESDDLSGSIVYLKQEGDVRDSIVTPVSGAYEFESLAWGRYEVEAQHSGYRTEDSTFYLDEPKTIDFELGRDILLNPPRQLTAHNALDSRVPMRWKRPDVTGAHLVGYIVKKVPAISGEEEVLDTLPKWCRMYIERDLTNGTPLRFRVSALYSEGESEYKQAWATPSDLGYGEGVLIYDYDNGADLCFDQTVGGAEALKDILEFFEIPHTLTDQDVSLVENEYEIEKYKAVFVSTGVDDEINNKIATKDLKLLRRYLRAGGRIYWEGADFGYSYFHDGTETSRTLYQMFGIDFAAAGDPYSEGGNVDSLYGNSEFFADSLYDSLSMSYDYETIADNYIDEIYLDEASELWRSQAFPPADSSNIRGAYYETSNYKTVYSSCYIGAVSEGDYPNVHYFYLGNVYEFLTGEDLPFESVEEASEYGREAPAVEVYPNPFSTMTNIVIAPELSGVRKIEIVDINGNEIAEYEFEKPVHKKVIEWHGEDQGGEELPGGVYFVKCEYSDGTSSSNKLLLIR